jgi:hypothetical protein
MTMTLSLSSFPEPRRGEGAGNLVATCCNKFQKALVSCATTYSKNHGLNLWKGSNLWYDFLHIEGIGVITTKGVYYD